MIIGIPKEIKNNENRVSLPPSAVYELVHQGHEVLVETNAGLASGITDEDYQKAGAKIVPDGQTAWSAEMVVKVKEPVPAEYAFFREDLLLFTYLHLAANQQLTEALIEKKVTAIAYESVELADGALPLLTPMSEIAGRMAAQIGAYYLEKVNGGKGILLAGVPGVRKGRVVIIGGGVVGENAAQIALGLGAEVTILDVNIKRLKALENNFNQRIQTLVSNQANLTSALKRADLVIGAVLIPNHKAPTLISKEMVAGMENASVIVDVAIDQGGIFETGSEVTTHDQPTYTKEGVVHYAVANMPGAVPQTATYALSNLTLPYVLRLANQPLETLLKADLALQKGVNLWQGKLTVAAIADDLNLAKYNLTDLL